MTYKEAESYVSSLLEGHRLHNMREEHDKPLEASAVMMSKGAESVTSIYLGLSKMCSAIRRSKRTY
jgi:hypothetical protein